MAQPFIRVDIQNLRKVNAKPLPAACYKVAPLATMHLLSCYFRSTFVEWNEGIFIQTQGVFIGLCDAPLIRDLNLAAVN